MAIFNEADWPGFRSKKKSLNAQLRNLHEATAELESLFVDLPFETQEKLNMTILSREVEAIYHLHDLKIDEKEAYNAILYCSGKDLPKDADLHLVNTARIFFDAQNPEDMILDQSLLQSWQASLFPAGFHGLKKIDTNHWREGEPENLYRGHVEDEYPNSEKLESEMGRFLSWSKTNVKVDPFLRTSTAHLWFVLLRPFEAGNSWMVHALNVFLLRKSIQGAIHPLNAVIAENKQSYFEVLNRQIHGTLDITEWLQWYFDTILQASEKLKAQIESALEITRKEIDYSGLSERQKFCIQELLRLTREEFTAREYADIAGVSPDTALRDIKKLIERNILMENEKGGRSSAYSFHDLPA